MIVTGGARWLLVAWLVTSCAITHGEAPVATPASKGFQQRQLEKIDTRIAAIRTHAAAGAQMYFLGVAGFGNQRVFAEEIALAGHQVADIFGSADRSLWLMNDRRDIETHPVASAASLRYGLKALGSVMDQDDVLFLAISSHGTRGAELVLSSSGLPEEWITRADLEQMLAASGIRWRIIVVSACYSGGHIESLANNHTIVITASASNRSSFGCSDSRDLTFFGEAFYRDAMARTVSLRAAFEQSRTDIRAQEAEKRFRQSQPQAYFGPQLESKLDDMLRSKREPAPDR